MKGKILTVLVALTTCFGVACGGGGDKHVHTYEWKSNETSHWEECECGEVKEQVAHAYDAVKADQDIHWSECVCGAKANEEVHSYVTKYDGVGHWQECDCGYSTEKVTHSYAYETNVDEHWQKCDCGFIGATVAHDYQTEYNADGHWQKCACGAKTEEQAHTVESKQDGDFHWTECACGYATEKVAHSYGEWQADKNDHWQECACGKKTEEGEHVENEQNKCETCGKVMEDLFTRVDGEGNPSATGEYILFGSYPQSEVTDSTVTATLTESAGALPTDEKDGKWTSYQYYLKGSKETDYAWYQDIMYSGEIYRGVYFTSYRPYKTGEIFTSSYQADNGYVKGAVYWFKYEPIKWQILEEESGYVTVLSEMIIDCQEYNYTDSSQTVEGETVYENNYARSSIRGWLNENFYETAFDKLQKEIVETVTVANGADTTRTDSNGNNPYACEDTEDKVWLLSYAEATTYFEEDEQREKKKSDYANSQGAWTTTGVNYVGNGYWWLRSPHFNNGTDARYVYNNGNPNGYLSVEYTHFGVSPALRIKLS